MAKTPSTERRPRAHADKESRNPRDPPPGVARPPTSKLLHELQVHQAELETQNEELRRTQVALEISRDRYMALYDLAPVGHLTLEDGGRIREVNLSGASLLREDRNSLVGRPFAVFVTPESRERWGTLLATLRRSNDTASCDLLLRRSDDSTFDGHVAGRGPGDGSADRAVRIALTDVTEHKKLERALRDSSSRLSFVLAGSNDGFWDVNVATGGARFSGRWASMLGYDTAELEPNVAAWRRLVHPDDFERVQATLEAHLRGETEQYECEHRLRHKDGRWIWVLSRGRVVERDGSGKPLRAAGTHTDIADRKRAEEAGHEDERRYRLAAMDALVAGMAHEINNPLAGNLACQGVALGVLQELRSRVKESAALDRVEAGRLLDEAVEALDAAQAGGVRVARIVKDMTALGQADPRRTRVRWIEIVEQALRWLPAVVSQAATVEVENRDAPDVMAAAGQLEQVVVNLVTNAAKATRAGSPGVIVVRIGPGHPGMARLEVVDRGTGIEPAILKRIFDPFFTTSDTGKGMGLGLAVSQAIVAAHHGTITVESVLGTGSTFRVELPAAPQSSSDS